MTSSSASHPAPDSPSPAGPPLDYAAWSDTLATLHLWTQIVGKVRLERTPWRNHSWHVPLYLTARGLTTSPIPGSGGVLQMDFDFHHHRLMILASDGSEAEVDLAPRSVADFYEEVMARLDELGFATRIHTVPSEIADGIPFEQDREHASYDAAAVADFAQVLTWSDRVFKRFQARFTGKVSPVHFFWGSFDLAVSRFSGRPAPEHPAGIPAMPDWVAREAYSHEVSSLGFWPGGETFPKPVFYSYAYPAPDGFSAAPVGPEGAFWTDELGEWLLPWEEVRSAADPEQALLTFAQDSYDAAADLADWDRDALEWPGRAEGPRRS